MIPDEIKNFTPMMGGGQEGLSEIAQKKEIKTTEPKPNISPQPSPKAGDKFMKNLF